MIVVEPASARFDHPEAALSSEEHLLERISALENRLTRQAEKLERALDLLLRQAQNSHFDRALVKALVGLLTDDGLIQGDKLERLWLDRCQKEAEEQQESERREQLRLKILTAYTGPERSAFEQFVNEGFLFIDDEELARGIRSLRRAAEIAPDNAPLLSFVGEHFFRNGQSHRARNFLDKAHNIQPADQRISLLLGLSCADDGDIERAKELLSSAARLGGSSFAVHYGLGRLFVAEENWPKALQEFKLALATKASPEAHYALGCLYYQLSRDSLATRHLRKALEMDQGYDEALYLLSLISERAAQKRPALNRPGKLENLPANPPSRTQRRNRTVLTAPLFQLPPARSRRLITGSDRRIAEALREDALTTGISVDLDPSLR